MDLIYLLKVLYRKIWIIIIVPVIAGVAAFMLTRTMEKEYKSTAQLSTGFTTNTQVQITKENFNYWESKANFENLVEVMKSELIGSMVAYNLLIHDLENPPYRPNSETLSAAEADTIIKSLKDKIASFDLLTSYDEFENRILQLLDEKNYSVSKWIKDNKLVIERIRDTDFVTVEFSSENPFLSSFVVNHFCSEYIRYYSNLKSNVTAEGLSFFATQVEQKKKVLDDITSELNLFKSENHVYNYEKESTAKLNQLAEFEGKLLDAEDQLKGISISLNNIKSRIENYDKTNINNSKLIELRQKINALTKIYVDGGSQDEELASSIRKLNTELEQALKEYGIESETNNFQPKSLRQLIEEKRQLEIDYEKALATVNSTQAKVNSLKASVSRIGSKESTIAALEREREDAFKDFSAANEKYNEAKAKSLIAGGGVKVMIKGQPNAEPESSKTLIILALAIVGSGALCIGTIVLGEYFDYRIKTPEKFEAFSKIHLVGYINHLERKNLDVRNLFSNKDSKRKEIELTKHFLRKIRFAIDNSGRRVFLLSSTRIGQGKTFVIMSLAQSLSLLNKRVLIIDTNFKHNSLTQLMAARPMLPKASEFKALNAGNGMPAQKQMDEDEYSRGFISHTNDKNIDIICSAEGSESPSEIFAGRDFHKMINALKDRYDYIFLEGAALNEFSDTRELTQYVDGVLAIFSAQSSLTGLDRESIKYLKSLNGKFLGAILNNLNKDDIKV